MKRNNWIGVLVVAGLLLGMSHGALADGLQTMTLPSDVSANNDLFSTAMTLMKKGGLLLFSVLGLAMLASVGWIAVKEFVVATRLGEWGKFGTIMVVGIVVLLLDVVIITLAAKYYL